MNTATLTGGQKLAVKYFVAAIVLFGAQLLFGLLAGIQFMNPDFLHGVLDFSVNRMVHINAMIVWMVFGFMGSVYWMLEDEAKADGTYALGLGNLGFWVIVLAVTVVVLVYLLVQIGPGEHSSLWLINEGREYIEAPRWADIGIVVWVLIFYLNVVGTVRKGKVTGITGVLMLNLLALAGLYLTGMFYTNNITYDQFWWWWVIHLWVEATWEVLVGVLMAWALIHLLGTRRSIVQGWLYIEVALMLGSGILGLGHHYFWIGTPEYWLAIGGFFSALEPIPLVAMVVHAIYDAGAHGMKNKNHPAMAWLIAHAFGNFLGAGVWGFMQTLPQINLYTHGTQWSASHGHLSFFGAYVTINVAFFYLWVQKSRGEVWMSGGSGSSGLWKWGLTLLSTGVIGMSIAMMVAGYKQAFVERAIEGSTWAGYFIAQNDPSFINAMDWRMTMGYVTVVGFVLLVWDLLKIGKGETRPAMVIHNEGH